jgi:hypothetical protein
VPVRVVTRFGARPPFALHTPKNHATTNAPFLKGRQTGANGSMSHLWGLAAGGESENVLSNSQFAIFCHPESGARDLQFADTHSRPCEPRLSSVSCSPHRETVPVRFPLSEISSLTLTCLQHPDIPILKLANMDLREAAVVAANRRKTS